LKEVSMKYLVTIDIPVEKGLELAAQGGPGPVLKQLSEQFKPEAMWGTPTKRSLFAIIELADAVDIAGLMNLCADKLGCYPHMELVVSAQELPGLAAKASEKYGVHA
jgi:hypothetical protein